jgi:AcrR family transcriptional regulator
MGAALPRRYDRSRRDAAMARTRDQIVEAVVALHAERGARDTSYAMIAERADVAVPTVYKHFPSLTELFAACVGHVGSRAPALGPEVFADAPDAPARLKALARAIVTRHRYFAPWLRWTVHEAPLIPELAVHHRRMNEARRALIAQAIAPAFDAPPPPALLGLLDSLFDYRTWQTLAKDHGLSDEEAAAAIANAGRNLLASQAPASTALGGTKRNSTRRI